MTDKTLKEMALDLKALKVPQRVIGEAIGVDQSTVSDFIHRTKGVRVHYKTYEALKKFHARKMKERARAA